jgi:hypothetical protein
MSITIKQGQSFHANCQYKENDQVTPKSLVGVTLTSKFRDKNDNVISVLLVTVTNAALGLFTLDVTESTSNFCVGTLYWDIFETTNGIISATVTETIIVSSGISR